jgi:hypothetical protein
MVADCEAAVDLSPLKNGQCPSGEKACFVNGDQQCVSTSDPKMGCSATNCVSCDVKVANAVTTCSSTDDCTIAACSAGYLDCNKTSSDGCEVNIRVSVDNCGMCGAGCAKEANSTPVCINSVCALQCAPGYGDCDLKYSNGCEASLQTDAKNCNECGTSCAAGQTCVSGSCK